MPVEGSKGITRAGPSFAGPWGVNARILFVLVGGLGACGQEPDAVERVAELTIDAGATAVAVLPGPDGSTIVTVANGARGVVDVLVAPSIGGPWETTGSAFAGSAPTVLAPGRVAGVDVLFVLTRAEVQMLEVDPAEPGRFAFPVRIRRDDGISTLDAGDLDGDGDDEVVVGGSGGVEVIGGLARAIGIVPSQVPQLDRHRFAGRRGTAAVAVLEEEGRVASAGLIEPSVRIDTFGGDGAEPESLPLPGVATALTSSMQVLLEDGQVVDALGNGAPIAGEIARLSAAKGSGIAARLDGTVGFGAGLEDLGLRFEEPPLLAAGQGLLAAVEPNAGRLHLFRW